MHELLHTRLLALVYDEMLDAGFDPSNIGDFTIDLPYWDLAMTKLMVANPSNTTQHQVLYNILMPEMIDNLMAMNNDTNPENREKYEYLVLSLLAKDKSPGGAIDDLVETGMVTWDTNGDGDCNPAEEDLNGDGVCDNADAYLQLDRLKSLSEELSNPTSNLELECAQ